MQGNQASGDGGDRAGETHLGMEWNIYRDEDLRTGMELALKFGQSDALLIAGESGRGEACVVMREEGAKISVMGGRGVGGNGGNGGEEKRREEGVRRASRR